MLVNVRPRAVIVAAAVPRTQERAAEEAQGRLRGQRVAPLALPLRRCLHPRVRPFMKPASSF